MELNIGITVASASAGNEKPYKQLTSELRKAAGLLDAGKSSKIEKENKTEDLPSIESIAKASERQTDHLWKRK